MSGVLQSTALEEEPDEELLPLLALLLSVLAELTALLKLADLADEALLDELALELVELEEELPADFADDMKFSRSSGAIFFNSSVLSVSNTQITQVNKGLKKVKIQ